MTIGNALFQNLAVRGFSRTQDKITDLQTQISSGQNDPRGSVNLMRASQLSALDEQRAALDRFDSAASQAQSRIALSDRAMADASDIMQRLGELSIQAGNDSLPAAGVAGIRAEAVQLRESLIEIANRSDATGRPLFAGYAAGPAFVSDGNKTTYTGDNGRITQRLSETLDLPVGLNGAQAFQGVSTENGPANVFDMIDDVIRSFNPEMHRAVDRITNEGQVRLDLNGTRDAQTVSFDLSGPNGTQRIEAAVMHNLPGPMIDAINAAAGATGITAEPSADGRGIMLTANGAGTGAVTVGNFESEDTNTAMIGSVQANDAAPITLRPARLSKSAMIARVNDMNDHFAAKQAEIGAIGATVDRQIRALDDRRLNLDTAVSQLRDLDIADAVTRLQTLMMTRDAAQQSFVKITQQTLFDYIR